MCDECGKRFTEKNNHRHLHKGNLMTFDHIHKGQSPFYIDCEVGEDLLTKVI